MLNIFKTQNGMNIVGQGGKIILFTLPSLAAAILVNTLWPDVAALPASVSFLRSVGYVLLAVGLILWGSAIVQLLTGFSHGNLVTTGAYGVVRNPIYSSAAFFLLPAVTLITFTWVYLVVSLFLYAGVVIFIRTEEKQLTKAFGKQYEDYLAAVDRLIPFRNFEFQRVFPGTRQQHLEILRKALLACGILSSVLYLITLTLGAARWEGYSAMSQTISELFAVDAPSRSFVVPPLIVYALLIYAFSAGVWLSAGEKRAMKAAAVLIATKEVFGLVATIITPMHMRGVQTNLSDTLHGVFTLVGVFLCMLPAMVIGAVSLGKKFRIYSIITILLFVAGGVFAFLSVPDIGANQPTPWAGLQERVNSYGYMLWIIVLSITFLRIQPVASSLRRRERILAQKTAANRV